MSVAAAGSVGSSQRVDRVCAAARALERWGTSRDWKGTDPYDALNLTRLRPLLRGSPLALRLLTQAVKRSPIDLRGFLGVSRGLDAATLGHLLSAYARNGFLDEVHAHAHLRTCIARLQELRSPGFPDACWGYHFDVQTRVFFYPRTTPNTIATAFAALGLLDAHEHAGTEGALELAAAAGRFFLQHVPQTEQGEGAYFGYLPGDATPIHNANMLVCAVLARLAAALPDRAYADAAAAGVRFTVARQRADGSWPYGEAPELGWVDGFHTGYVLDCLLTCIEHDVGGAEAERAWHHGLRFYAESLIEPTGLPRYTPDSRYPIDAQCAAQAIETLSRANNREPRVAERRWQAFDYAIGQLRRRDGAFVFQRERLWINRTPHPRWVQAPMLAALSRLLASSP